MARFLALGALALAPTAILAEVSASFCRSFSLLLPGDVALAA